MVHITVVMPSDRTIERTRSDTAPIGGRTQPEPHPVTSEITWSVEMISSRTAESDSAVRAR